MDLFRQAKIELKSAERAISLMKIAKSFEEFEDAWKNYLNNIEKCWKKVERVCQPVKNRFQPWQGTFVRLRRKDMLLKYLLHARNADQHSIQEIIEHIRGSVKLKHLGGSGHVKSMKIVSGEITEYIGSPLIIENYPSKIQLLRFKNGSDWYNPPTQHLDKNIKQRDPLSVAQKGLEFYNQFLKEAEVKFVASIPAN